MWLLIVICLTGPGTMSEPFVSASKTEAECLHALLVDTEVAQKHGSQGYVALCVRVERVGV